MIIGHCLSDNPAGRIGTAPGGKRHDECYRAVWIGLGHRFPIHHQAKHLKQSIVVENVAGASGAIGHGRVKSAVPDGYTIGLGSMGTLAASVAVIRN